MKQLLIIFVLLFSISGSLFSSQEELLLTAGNRDYLEGKWLEALGKYKQVEDDGWQSGTMFYNVGNCYFKLNELGEAIYYWEKAVKLLGNDPDLEMNLKIARAHVTDKVDEQVVLPVWGWLDRTRSILLIGTRSWVVIAVSGLLFALLAVRRWLVRSLQKKQLLKWVCWVIAVRLILDLFFVAFDANYAAKSHWGIVLRPEVEVLSAPAEKSGKLLFSIHEGSKVRVVRELEEWIEVSAGKDKQGWVKRPFLGMY